MTFQIGQAERKLVDAYHALGAGESARALPAGCAPFCGMPSLEVENDGVGHAARR
jgi:hypothetical protein